MNKVQPDTDPNHISILSRLNTDCISYWKKKPTHTQNSLNLTKQQRDAIVKQLCIEYNCAWGIVSTALYKQHGIDMSQAAIRTRFMSYLNPHIQSQKYNYDEQFAILKMYFIQGKGYADIVKAYGDRQRNMIRNMLQQHIRRAIRRIQKFLNLKISYQDRFIQGYLKKKILISKLRGERTVEYHKNKHALSVLYCFMVFNKQQVQTIPKILAELLYERLQEITVEKYEALKKMNPNVNPLMYANKETIKREMAKQNIQFRKRFKEQREDSIINCENNWKKDVSVKFEDGLSMCSYTTGFEDNEIDLNIDLEGYDEINLNDFSSQAQTIGYQTSMKIFEQSQVKEQYQLIDNDYDIILSQNYYNEMEQVKIE